MSVPPGGAYTNLVIKAFTSPTNQSRRGLARDADRGPPAQSSTWILTAGRTKPLSQQVLRAPVTAFQARPTEKSAETRKIPGCEAWATVQSPRRSRQPAPRLIDQ